MKSFTPNLTKFFKVVFLTLALVAFTGNVASASWQEPPANPPNENTPAPVNVGTAPQVKDGDLTVDAFAAMLNSFFGGKVGIGVLPTTAKLEVAGTVKVVDGSEGLNKIFTSDADGLASWKTLSSLLNPANPNTPTDAEAICNALKGVWNPTAESCSFGGGGGGSSGVSSISAGANVTVTPPSGTGAVTVSVPTASMCTALGGTWDGSACAFAGGGFAGVTKILGGTNITVSPASGTGNVTVSGPAFSTICTALGGTWNGTSCAFAGSATGVTSATAGPGIIVNPTTGDINISADTTYLQRRVSGTCPAGQAIRVISIAGTVTCEPVGGGGTTGVTKIIGSTNVLISPSLGTGNVTILLSHSGICASLGGTWNGGASSGSCTFAGGGTTGVTSVTGGTGVIVGPTTGNVVVNIDQNIWQKRVTGTCTGNTFIQSVTPTGTVVCGTASGGTGGITQVLGGSGISTSQSGSVVTVTNTQTPGEINAATNVGSGTGIFHSKNGSYLQFRSLAGINGVNIGTVNGDTVVVSPPTAATTCASLGGTWNGTCSFGGGSATSAVVNGTYVGNGTATGQSITVGFRPKLVILTSSGTTGTNGQKCTSNRIWMRADTSAYPSTGFANAFTPDINVNLDDIALMSGGFAVRGGNQSANQSAAPCNTYSYTAFR